MVAALVWDRQRLLKELKSERMETQKVIERLLGLAERMSDDDLRSTRP